MTMLAVSGFSARKALGDALDRLLLI
ncbi:MAG: hypothetical protein ACD_23C00280G0001, partial [uncultured bacterium]